MMYTIPRWALERACAAIGRKVYHYDRMGEDNILRQSIAAHALVIAEHEKPPVDPLLLKAREIAARAWSDQAKAYSEAEIEAWQYAVLQGRSDNEWWMQSIVEALRQ